MLFHDDSDDVVLVWEFFSWLEWITAFFLSQYTCKYVLYAQLSFLYSTWKTWRKRERINDSFFQGHSTLWYPIGRRTTKETVTIGKIYTKNEMRFMGKLSYFFSVQNGTKLFILRFSFELQKTSLSYFLCSMSFEKESKSREKSDEQTKLSLLYTIHSIHKHKYVQSDSYFFVIMFQ